MNDDKPEVKTVTSEAKTFSTDEAQTIIDLLGITHCSICGKPITPQNLGGADFNGAFCDDVVCVLAFLDHYKS